jgi:hypothetical protein
MSAGDTATALDGLFRDLSGGEVQTVAGHTLYRLAAFGYVVTRMRAYGGEAFVISDVDGPLANVGALVILSQGELTLVPGEVDDATRAALERFMDEAVRPEVERRMQPVARGRPS